MSKSNSGQSASPNVLFIHAESMDGRTMGCMGHPAMQGITPNMDALAKRGVLFRQAYSASPVCNPSRACMWSGKYPNHNDCWNNNSGLHAHVPTFWNVLERSGKRYANFGKLDYEYGLHSIRDKVGSWTRRAEILRPTNKLPLPMILDEHTHPGDWSKSDQLITELRAAKDDQRPFFCCMSTALVHPTFVTSPNYYERIDPRRIQIPPGLRDVDDTDHPVDRYARITKNHARAIAPELALEIRRVYCAMIAELDDIVGKVLRAVDELGLSDSTYIVFSSDHGEMAAEHNQVLKRTMYEPSIHVPLIVAGPGVRQNAVVDTPVSLVDLYPTFMDMLRLNYADYAAGDDWPADLDGESILPQLEGAAPRTRDWAFAEYHGDRCLTGSYMLRRDNWKLIHHVGYPSQLFDVSADPWEQHDLAAERADVLGALEALLAGHFDCAGIEKRARRDDRRRFLEWRTEEKRQGTYHDSMSRIYSGFSRLCIDDYRPWTEADERKIEEWLAREE